MNPLRRYTKIIDNLIDSSDYWKLYFQAPISLQEEYYEDECIISCGVSRCGIIDRDEKNEWIVKIDIEGDARSESLCARELQFYHSAVQAGIKDCFCEAQFLGYYERDLLFYEAQELENLIYESDLKQFQKELEEESKNLPLCKIHICLPLYGYHKAECEINIFDIKPSNKERDFVCEHASPLSDRNLNIGFYFLKDWGADMYARLSEFMEDNGINDIHRGNVGIIGGKIVLIDYAGYHEDDGEEYYDYHRTT